MAKYCLGAISSTTPYHQRELRSVGLTAAPKPEWLLQAVDAPDASLQCGKLLLNWGPGNQLTSDCLDSTGCFNTRVETREIGGNRLFNLSIAFPIDQNLFQIREIGRFLPVDVEPISRHGTTPYF